jgi:hypothetical protein
MIALEIRVKAADDDLVDLLHIMEQLAETGPDDMTVRLEMPAVPITAAIFARVEALRGALGPRFQFIQTGDWTRPAS